MKDIFDNQHFRLTKILMSCIGQWPRTSKSRRNLARILIMGNMYSIAPAMTYEMFHLWTVSKSAVVPCIPPLLTCTVCTVKFVNYIIYQKQFTSLLDYMERDSKTITEKEHRRIVEKYWMRGKSITSFYSTYLYVSMVAFLLIPLSPIAANVVSSDNETRGRRLLYPADYGIDMEKNWHWCIIHEYTATVLAVSIIVASDSMYITLACHACGLFAVTRHRLNHIGNIDESEMGSISWDNNAEKISRIFKKKIDDCIKQHNIALKFVVLLEYCFSWSLLIVVGINGIIVSITGLQIMTKIGMWDELLTAIIYTAAQLLHLFFLSLPGQILINESTGVRDSAYESNWYNIPNKERMLLIQVLLRSERPCQLSAGKIIILHMETFTTILQTSLAYFTTLTSVQDK